jgi:DNA-binding IclR family transcriptional regulator
MLRNKVECSEDKRTLTITDILDVLSDGGWHKFDELSAETSISKEKVLRVVNFFRDFGFVEVSMGGEAAKLDKDYLKL